MLCNTLFLDTIATLQPLKDVGVGTRKQMANELFTFMEEQLHLGSFMTSLLHDETHTVACFVMILLHTTCTFV